MNTGHHEDTWFRIMADSEGDWVRAFLALKVEHEPGSHFVYNTGASFILSAIIQKITGLTLVEYLTPRLFTPLGFAPVLWDESPRGINAGGWGIVVRLEDVAKLGQLYLNKGTYNGKRLLSESWVRDATSFHSDNSITENATADWAQGYGYQFWLCQHGAVRGDGAFGQYNIIMPEQDAVLAIMSETINMQEILDIVWRDMLPGFTETSSPTEALIQGKAVTLDENPLGLAEIGFHFDKKALTLNIKGKDKTATLKSGPGDWLESEVLLPFGHVFLAPLITLGKTPRKISSYYIWKDPQTLEINWVCRDTPHRETLTFRFNGSQVHISCPPGGEANVFSNIELQGAVKI
jgi:hypothetical protein